MPGCAPILALGKWRFAAAAEQEARAALAAIPLDTGRDRLAYIVERATVWTRTEVQLVPLTDLQPAADRLD